MTITLVTLARDAVRLEYPWEEAVLSMADLADQIVINAGRSDDGTLELAHRIAQNVDAEVLERDWDDGLGGAMLAHETRVAMEQARGDWIIYAQADEVLHEDGLTSVMEAIRNASGEVQGLTFDFVHHYANPDTVATSRLWYEREVRAVRRSSGADSFHHAQGFRVNGKRLAARESGGRIHHYGWCRSGAALGEKRRLDNNLYHGVECDTGSRDTLPWEWGLRPFTGTHPVHVRPWIERHRNRCPNIAGPVITARQLRLMASSLLESIVRRPVFRYRNFDLT